MLYLIEQCLNGIQLGMLLFLLAAGLTLMLRGRRDLHRAQIPNVANARARNGRSRAHGKFE
jgi:hypothetical protein